MTTTVLFQLLTLAAALGGPSSALLVVRAQKRRTVAEAEKLRQDTKGVVDQAVREQAEFLRSEMQQVRDELGRERSGRRDCDQHLAETTSELRRANHRIDSQGREIAALKSEIGMLRAAVDMNSQRIDLQDLQTDQSVPPGPNPFDQQGEPA